MNRPDKIWNKLSVAEKEVGGIPNSSEDIDHPFIVFVLLQLQARNAVEGHIYKLKCVTF